MERERVRKRVRERVRERKPRDVTDADPPSGVEGNVADAGSARGSLDPSSGTATPRPAASSAELLEALARACDLAVLVVDLGGATVMADERFAQMFDVDPASLGGKTLADLRTMLQGSEGGAGVGELLVVAADDAAGELSTADGRTLQWQRAPTRDAKATVWTFRDVSAERVAQRALGDAENWLRMFAAHTDGLVLELDVDARIVGVWAPTTSMFANGALNGQSLVEALGPDEGIPFEARVRDVLATGHPANFEIVRGEGATERVFAVNAVLVPAIETLPSSCTVLVRDVTERAQLQKQLLQAEKLASLGVLAAGIAHEINNPLAYMLLNLERLRTALGARLPGHDEDLGLAVQLTVEGAERIQEIVLGLKRFARSERDDPLGPTDMRRVLTFTSEMISVELRGHARLILELGDVPPVMASEGRLTQVFLNLLLNAVQSIGEGETGKNEIRLVSRTDEHGRAVVDVQDTGGGIAPAVLPHIFDPFFTTRAPGTGLGLAICHGLVTSLGGEIWVDTKVGSGSTFHVALPSAGPIRDT